jgi:aspartate-semialdehyde dehydrogenase
MGGHSESVNVEFENDFDLDEVKQLLSESAGITLQDNVAEQVYPMPLWAHEKDDVFVGRLRRDESQPNTLICGLLVTTLEKALQQTPFRLQSI